MSGFYNDATQLLKQSERDVRAWLGALQYVTYTRPARRGIIRKQRDDGTVSESHISWSADGWFEGLKRTLEGALKSAEAALENEWMKRRDPRHDNEDARDQFAQRFEDSIARIAAAVLDAENDISKGVVTPNRAVRESLAEVKESLKSLINLYDTNCYELTFRETDTSLLALRARIMDGSARAM
jgi:hypothetical protein